ncbi:hypothetical protein BSKO_09715 [Bryopsis sp. KO-2023]|nr:hypothetical protein BSKO_09715 [Bryopsis sp. KO-2023]
MEGCLLRPVVSRPSLKLCTIAKTPSRIGTVWRCRAAGKIEDESMSDPLLNDCPVPLDQQPVQELKYLQDAFLFNWATLPVPDFATRLAIVFAGFFGGIGLPVSAVTFDPSTEPIQCVVAASAGSLVVVLVTVIRLYLGWSHVGDRLLSATVEYEETGWYDGQIWVKTPQVLTRDRLEGNYTVKPAINRLKATLLTVSGAAALSVVLLSSLPGVSTASAVSDFDVAGTVGVQAKSNEEYWEIASKYEPMDPEDLESFIDHMRIKN